MNLTRCENGHFYDKERFDSCPHCNQPTISTVVIDTEGEHLKTEPISSGLTDVIPDTAPANNFGVTVPNDKTVGYFDEYVNEPVVGWLVALTGNSVGRDFRLVAGKNFIGRANNMNVALEGDETVSRDKHAIVLYEPKENIFIAQPGESNSLYYLNGKVVLGAVELHAYDKLSIGETDLLFIPFCADKFKWDDLKEKKEQQ